MTRTTLAAGARSYAISEDVRLGYRTIAIGRVTSTVAGMPIPAHISVSTPRADLRAIVRDGDFCLAADTERSFPTAETIDLTVSAQGFAPRTASVTIDPASLPSAAGMIALRPLPVRLQGRVVAADTGEGIAAARVLGIDDPNVGAMPPTHTVVLGRPLAREHTSGTTAVEPLESAAATGPVAADTSAGESRVRLATRSGLSAPAIVGIGPIPGGDYMEVARVVDAGPEPLADPGDIVLRDPLTQTIRRATEVEVLTFSGTGAATTLAGIAEAGSAVVVTGDLLAGLVRIDTGEDEEYRFVGVLTDGDGFYHLDGLAGVLSLWLEAKAPGYSPGHRAVTVRYGTPVTVVDFQLTP